MSEFSASQAEISQVTANQNGMKQGVVKWFSPLRGYGFIGPAALPHTYDAAPTDVFVHFRAIEMEGYRFLRDRQPVAYELENWEDDCGLRAARVITQEEYRCRLAAHGGNHALLR